MTDRYFDHAATTPVAPEVLEAMLPWLRDDFGNAHSLHHWGRKAEAAVEEARAAVAELMGADDPSEIIFTGSATESSNWVLTQFDHVAISEFEHSAVRESALSRPRADLLRHKDGRVQTPESQPQLIAVMAVNNETGAILTPPKWTGPVFIDAVQAVGKIAWSPVEASFASVSAHKIYGPKGIGALYVRGGSINPMIRGGDQEMGRRAGTLNVPGIVGFGAAASLAMDRQSQDFSHAEQLRRIVVHEFDGLDEWQVNEGPEQSPFILSLSFRGIEGETLVIEADAAGFGISSGAACSSRSTEPSHVLMALGMEESWRRGTIRISFGRSNTATSALELASFLRQTIARLRSNL